MGGMLCMPPVVYCLAVERGSSRNWASAAVRAVSPGMCHPFQQLWKHWEELLRHTPAQGKSLSFIAGSGGPSYGSRPGDI